MLGSPDGAPWPLTLFALFRVCARDFCVSEASEKECSGVGRRFDTGRGRCSLGPRAKERLVIDDT